MRARLAGLSAALVGIVGLALMFAETLRVLNGNLLGTAGEVLVILGAALVLVAALLVLTDVRRARTSTVSARPADPAPAEPTEA